jgi:hypothetical protein
MTSPDGDDRWTSTARFTAEPRVRRTGEIAGRERDEQALNEAIGVSSDGCANSDPTSESSHLCPSRKTDHRNEEKRTKPPSDCPH